MKTRWNVPQDLGPDTVNDQSQRHRHMKVY